MTPEVQAAFDRLRADHLTLTWMCVAALVMLAVTLVLKVLIYCSIIRQLHACWAILSAAKSQGMIASQRRDEAKESLSRIEQTVADSHSLSLPVPVPVTLYPPPPPADSAAATPPPPEKTP